MNSDTLDIESLPLQWQYFSSKEAMAYFRVMIDAVRDLQEAPLLFCAQSDDTGPRQQKFIRPISLTNVTYTGRDIKPSGLIYQWLKYKRNRRFILSRIRCYLMHPAPFCSHSGLNQQAAPSSSRLARLPSDLPLEGR
jgi:hypothetical protein